MAEHAEIGREIRCIQRLIHHHAEKSRLKSNHSLTFVQIRTLSYLLMNQESDIYQKDVEKELNIRRSTATELLNVLERDEYIARVSVEKDKRLKKLVVTQKAQELGKHMQKDIQEMEILLAKGISKEDLEHFFRVTKQIKMNLKGEISDD